MNARRTIALDASAGAIVAAAVIAGYDYDNLQQLAVPRPEALRVSVAASSFVAVIGALLAAMAARLSAPILQRGWTALSEIPARAGARLLVGVSALVASGAVTYAGAAVAQHAFASDRVRRLAVTALVLVLVGMFIATREGCVQRLERWLDGVHRPRAVSVAVSGLLLIASVAALLYAAWPVLLQMQLRPLTNAAAIGATALTTAMLSAFGIGRERTAVRRGRYIVAALGACSVAVIAWTMLVPSSRSLLVALEQKPTLSTFVLREIREGGRRLPRPANPASDRSAVCSPDAKPPKASDVGRAIDDAPDIVLITVDAVRWDHTSMSGYQRDTTPHMNEHAEAAAVFERAYSPASSTRQTLRAVLSGVHSSLVYYRQNARQKWGVAFSEAQVTFAEYLRAAGYETIALSSSAKLFSTSDGAVDGFDIVDESASRVRSSKSYCADYIVDRIIERLNKPRQRPRFIWTHLHEPHQPYDRPDDSHSFGDEEQDRYDASIHWVDQQLGRLLKVVRSKGHADRTFLFVSADHGQAFGEHESRYHGKTVYQEQVHVPLLVWGPGVEPRRIATPVSLIDLLPTALDLAGLEIPAALCGRSWRDALRGGDLSARPLYIENVPDHTRAYFSVAMIDGNLKTVLKPKLELYELYRLDTDPRELDDLAGSHAALLKRQLARLRELQLQRGLDPAAYGLDP